MPLKSLLIEETKYTMLIFLHLKFLLMKEIKYKFLILLSLKSLLMKKIKYTILILLSLKSLLMVENKYTINYTYTKEITFVVFIQNFLIYDISILISVLHTK